MKQKLLSLSKPIKILLTFTLSTLAPSMVWLMLSPFVAFASLVVSPSGFSSLGDPAQIGDFTINGIETLAMMLFLAFSSLGLVLFFSITHTLFLGFPVFIIANQLGFIRWYTVLPASFLIGSVPYHLLFLLFRFPVDFHYFGPIMGLFGLCAGFAFWVLWRYWASPESYVK